MQKLKLVEEPDCWCGPNSQLALPKDFREVPEDHFALDAASSRELELLLEQRSREATGGLPGFTLRNAPPSLATKQRQLAAELDRATVQIHAQPEQLHAAMRELWRANNIEVYDLSAVDYDHAAALRSNFADAQLLDASDSQHLQQPRFVPPPRMAQEKQAARGRGSGPSPSFADESWGN